MVRESSLRPPPGASTCSYIHVRLGIFDRTLLRRVADRKGKRLHQAKRENRKTILPQSYRGLLEDKCLQTIFEMRFFLVERNSEEFSVILGIVGKRSERSRSLRCRQKLMEFPVKGWCKHSIQPSFECCYSLRFSVSWPVGSLRSWQR